MKIKFGLSAILALATISVVDARYQACSKDMYYDLDACQCFMRDTCALRCGYNTVQDPREKCACTDKDEIEALYDHVGYDAQCKKLRPSVIQEVDEGIQKYEEIVQKLEETIKKQEETIEKQEETIEKREVTIEKQEEKIEKREETIENKDETIEWLLETVRELRQTIKELQEEKTEEPEETEEIQVEEPFMEPELISCDFGNYVPLLEEEEEDAQCMLTIKDCPNEDFSVNREKCECQCDLYCVANMSVDPETCSCKPIEIHQPIVVEPFQKPVEIEIEIVEESEPVEVIQLFRTCDADGNKICPTAKCMEGSLWDDRACICAPLMKCRKFCPQGQGLDPREVCSCIDQSEIDALYQCEPDKDIEEIEIVIKETNEPKELEEAIFVPQELPSEEKSPRGDKRRGDRRQNGGMNPYAQRRAEFDEETAYGQPQPSNLRQQNRRPYQDRPRQNKSYTQGRPERQNYRQGNSGYRQSQPQYNRY